MQWVGLISQVAATLLVLIPLLHITWRRRSPFALLSAIWKLGLFAVIVWFLALGIEVVVRRSIQLADTGDGDEYEYRLAKRHNVFPMVRDHDGPRTSPWPTTPARKQKMTSK